MHDLSIENIIGSQVEEKASAKDKHINGTEGHLAANKVQKRPTSPKQSILDYQL
jgi:hypothetical protein